MHSGKTGRTFFILVKRDKFPRTLNLKEDDPCHYTLLWNCCQINLKSSGENIYSVALTDDSRY